MDKKAAVTKWSDACVVVENRGVYIRDGNWQTIDRALRHCADTSTVDQKGSLNGDMVVLVTPAPKKTAEGKSPLNLPPFLLVVR
jgi:hypothetical protein